MKMSAGVFATIRFKELHLDQMKRLTKSFVLMTRNPVYLSFEQRGETRETAGGEPHVHVLMVTKKPAESERLISRFFRDVTQDVLVLPKTPYLMADLFFRYLKGFKKEYVDSPRIRGVTAAWVKKHQLEPIAARGIEAILRQRTSRADMQKIRERIRLYQQ